LGKSLFIPISILLLLTLTGCNMFDYKQSFPFKIVAFFRMKKKTMMI